MLAKPPNKYCFLIGQTLLMSSLYETHIGDVIALCFLVLMSVHQFSCSSHQKQGSLSTINKPLNNINFLFIYVKLQPESILMYKLDK